MLLPLVPVTASPVPSAPSLAGAGTGQAHVVGHNSSSWAVTSTRLQDDRANRTARSADVDGRLAFVNFSIHLTVPEEVWAIGVIYVFSSEEVVSQCAFCLKFK